MRATKAMKFSRATATRILRQFIVIAAITFILAEVSFRAYNAFDPLPIFFSKSYNRWRGKPFSSYYDFQLNSHGFKDVEFNVKKEAGTYRILGIGDSFAFGVVPYKANYLTLIGQELKRRGRKVELINMGIVNLGPIDYLSVLVHEGLQLEPDMVLLSFFIGNDFESPSHAWWSYSYAATAVKSLIELRTSFEGQVFGGSKYEDDAKTFTDEKYLQIERARSTIFLKSNKHFDTDFVDTWTYIDQMKRICDTHGIRLVTVIIPDEVQINGRLKEEVLASFGLDEGIFDFARPNKMLHAELDKDKIGYIDLLTPFVEASPKSPLYKPNDTHWNIEGNLMASKIIEEHLARYLDLTAGDSN
jgi:hypothetical protein